MRLLRFARNDTPFCHCEEAALADDEAIYLFAELTQKPFYFIMMVPLLSFRFFCFPCSNIKVREEVTI